MQSTQKRRLVVASGNKHKIHEISQIFTDFEVLSQKQMGFDEDVEETGATFMETRLSRQGRQARRSVARCLRMIAVCVWMH